MVLEFLKSAYLLGKGIIEQYKWLIFSFVAGSVNIYQHQVAPHLQPGWELPFPAIWSTISLVVSISAAVLAVVLTYHKARMEGVNLERRLIRRLEIVHGEGSPFVQHNQLPQGIEWLYRIGVRSDSLRTVDAVVVSVTRVEKVDVVGLPCRLHWMNDNPQPRVPYRESMPVNPGRPEFVDVVLISPLDNQAQLFSSVPGVIPQFRIGTYVLVIDAVGTDCEPTTAKFTLSFDGQSSPRFVRE